TRARFDGALGSMNASTRLVLIAAGGCAALGFALKIADLTGGASSTASPARVERAAGSRTASRPGEPLDVGHDGSRTDVASAWHEHRDAATRGGSLAVPVLDRRAGGLCAQPAGRRRGRRQDRAPQRDPVVLAPARLAGGQPGRRELPRAR